MLSEDAIYAALGARIRVKRQDAKITQDTLANRLGLTRTSISNIERGQQKIQIHTLFAIADSLGVEVTVLLPMAEANSEEQGMIEAQIPDYLQPKERDWVRRVLNTAGE